jgi:uncharacterized protein
MIPMIRYLGTISVLTLSVMFAPMIRVDAQETTPSAPVLRQGAFWSEDVAKEKLDEYAGTWSDRASWERRAAAIRVGILRGAGLYPLPQRAPLNPIIRGERNFDGYTVANIAIESIPGLFVTGNLYRPTAPPPAGGYPAILLAHGHTMKSTIPFGINKTAGRFSESTQTVASVMARMGAVVMAYDMTGRNESSQYPHSGPLALAVQLWNSMRVLDFLITQPGVDPGRIGMTGVSGGGTQTFLLSAVDSRVSVSIPVVQVSAYFFGGCMCESGMPIHVSDSHDTCNAEIAALFAPKPQLVISDGKDWTKNVDKVEYLYIRSVYGVYGAENMVENLHLPLEGHDYGPSKRQGAYAFFSQHLGIALGNVPLRDGLVDERFVTVKDYESLSVFDAANPRPDTALTDPAEIESLLLSGPAQSMR